MDREGHPAGQPAATHPLLPLAGAYSLGILLEARLLLPPTVWATAGLGLLAVVLLAWRLGYRRLGHVLVAASVLGIGAQAMGIALLSQPSNHLSRLPATWLATPVEVEGWVAVPPDPIPADRRDAPAGDRMRFVAELTRLTVDGRGIAVSGRARLSGFGDYAPVAYGRTIRGTFRLRHPRAFGNPGAFDYPGHLASQKVFLEGWTREPLEIGEAVVGSRLLAEIYRLRGRLLQRFDEALAPERAAVVKAMVLGDRSGLTPDMVDAFLGSGTFHILAISGLHVSLLAGAAFGGLRLLWVPARLSAILTLLLVALYAGLAGAGASVVRAAVMANVFLLAIVLDRKVNLLNSLALAALVLLWWNPRSLFEVGFQLTFLATLGIVLVVPWTAQRLQAAPRPLRAVLASVAITLAATAMTAPILAAAFQRVTPIGVLANLPVVPLCGAITTLGLTSGAALLILPDGLPWLSQAAGSLVDILGGLTRWFAAWPGASLAVYVPTPGMTLAYYGVLAGVGLCVAGRGGARRGRGGVVAAVAGVLFVGQILLHLVPFTGSETVRLTVLDVGQGEAMLLELPGRTRILVDAGGRLGEDFDVGRRIVVPFLRHAWIGRLDAVVVTHPETDHAHGVAAVLEQIPVAEVWTGPRLEGSATARWLDALLRQHRIPHRVVTADSPPLRAGPAVLEVLSPPATGGLRGDTSRPEAINETSLVFRIGIHGKAILLTGDIGRVAEAALLAAGRPLRAEVLKVPHHGSRASNSPPFLLAVDPDVAVVSVGFRNRFRHPHPEVIERYRVRGVRLLRTDRDGAVVVEIAESGVRVRTHRETRRGERQMGS